MHDAPIARSEPLIARTAFVSTYPPRRCGIATFTSDLSRVTEDREIAALHPPEQVMPYPVEVHHRIRRDEPADYIGAARSLGSCVDVVSIQWDDAIWGGDDGSLVLDFLAALDVPAVATLHAVRRDPTPRQRATLVGLIAGVQATVVMSRAAMTLLTTVYGVSPDRVGVIPHGVPNLPLVASEAAKPGLDLAGRPVMLSFGLLGPAKGYEVALDALPAIVADHPTVCYVVVGPTHPDVIRRDGEAYRTGLVERVKKLGMTEHVRFVDRFVGRVELTRWLQAADVFVTPYPDLEQLVSGTLSYAMGAGRAIVATPFSYAADLLADGRGVLVTPGSAVALAAGISDLLGDDARRLAIGRGVYDHSRPMVWPEVGADYRRLLSRVAADRSTVASTAILAALRI